MSGRRLQLPLFAASAAGGLPLPRSDQTFPEVRGTVTRAGLTVAGAEIFAAVEDRWCRIDRRPVLQPGRKKWATSPVSARCR